MLKSEELKIELPQLAQQLQQKEVGRAMLVVNAKARQGQENFQQVMQELETQGIKLVDAHAVANPRFIKPLVERIVQKEKLDTVLVGGGDGTLSALSDVLAHRRVRLGVIPMGTANDFARNLSIPNNIAQAVAIIKEGKVRPIDLGLAGGRYFLNVASVGLGVDVASNMDADLKKWLGPLAYGAAAVQSLRHMRPLHVRLIFKDRPRDGGFESVEFRALQVAVANGRFYGGGMVSAPTATITDGKLAVAVIEIMNNVELLGLLPGLRNGTYVRHPKVHHFETTDVVVETRHSRSVNLDGEVCQRTPLSFKVARSALEVYTAF